MLLTRQKVSIKPCTVGDKTWNWKVKSKALHYETFCMCALWYTGILQIFGKCSKSSRYCTHSIHNYRNSSAMTVCYTYCMYMCVCVLPLSQLSTHHSGISVIPAITADGSPHTIQIHFYCTIQLGSASLQSQRTCKHTQS